jgi:hypothetical protein
MEWRNLLRYFRVNDHSRETELAAARAAIEAARQTYARNARANNALFREIDVLGHLIRDRGSAQ